jgi:hypothetical protein
MTAPRDKTQSDDTQPARRNRPAAVSGDVGQVGRGAFVRMGFSDPTLVLRWREIAGPEVARLCQPIRFAEGPNGGTLTLKALPGAALFLSHETRSLTARINQYLGRPAVSRLKFVHGALALARPAFSPRRPATDAKPGDPSEFYDGPAVVKEALQSLARWRQGASDGAED